MEATPEAIEKALEFLRAARLRGGTNVQAALDAALAQAFTNDPYIVVLGDLGATRGIFQNGKLAEWYAAEMEADRRRRGGRARMFSRSATTRIFRSGRCWRAINGVFRIGALHRAGRFQAECVSVEDRAAAGG